jgi:putative inorganic carbon (hco3(-)) transporter
MMPPEPTAESQQPVSNRLLLVFIASLPLMKPAIAYPIVLPDLIFAALLIAFAGEFLKGTHRPAWRREYWIPVIYVASFFPSLAATPDIERSLFKLATQFYLVSLAVLTAALIRTERDLRRALQAWLTGTAIVAAVSTASWATFAFAPDSLLLDYARSHFGSLPPTRIPRLSSTFLNANMACNYLSISAVILLAARQCGWVSKAPCLLLLTGIAIAALATMSPGLGGVGLVVGLWLWADLRRRRPVAARMALVAAIGSALAFVVAMAVTPILHPTAPFLITVPGTEILLAPSPRWMLWTGSLAEFARNPIVGHGIGIDATLVRYLDPSGTLQIQTEAHNSFLNIAAQCGLVGLFGLAALLACAWRLTRPLHVEDCASAVRVALGLGFLCAFAYQGLGGSFEDTRHLWVLLGLLMASARLSRAGENSHRAGVPSRG